MNAVAPMERSQAHRYMPPPASMRFEAWSDPVGSDDAQHWALWSLHRVDEGLAVVDAVGRVRFANRCATELLDDSEVLFVQDGCLGARSAADQAALRAGLAAVAQRGLFRVLRLGPADASQFVALSLLGQDTQQRLVLCKLGRRALCNRLTLQWYAQLCGLTSAEANVMQQLCDGAEPCDIARRHAVALSTVRTQIGAIRGKTGHGSIRELLCTLATLPVVRRLQPVRDCDD